MASSLRTSEDDVVILKAGWIFRQKPFFKKWKKSWMVVSLGGSLKYFKNKRSSTPQKAFNIKNECMSIKYGRQCRHMLPPNDVDPACLMELFFTGDRSLKLCAHDIDSAALWASALQRSQAEASLPTPRYSRKNRTKEDALKEESQEQNELQKKWYAFLCCGTKNKVQTFTTPRIVVTSSWS